MNDLVQLIGVALSGGAITGFATILATYLTNKQKVQEIQIQYQMKLEDSVICTKLWQLGSAYASLADRRFILHKWVSSRTFLDVVLPRLRRVA